MRNPTAPQGKREYQEGLGSLCYVFPVAHGACESCNFLEEDQGRLEQLVYHESLRQKLDILTSLQVTRAKQCHNDHICDCMISEFYIGKLESR
jgi:hypothetical protein